MVPDTSRRALLHGTVAAAAALAGCGGNGTDDPRPDDYVPQTSTDSPGPDAGSGAYGLFLQNRTEDEHEVQVLVELPWEDETPFEKRLTMAGRTAREWNTVVTVQEEVSVVAHLDAAIEQDFEDRGKQRRLNDHLWLIPGSETAPAVENVQVRVVPDDDGSRILVRTIDEFRDTR